MKYIAINILLLGLCVTVIAQNTSIDSLRLAYAKEKTDTGRVVLLSKMADLYAQNRPDSELFIAQQALFISRNAKFINGELWSLKQMAEAYQFMGNYPLALQYYLLRLQLDEKNPDHQREVVTILSIANLYQLEGDYKHALEYAKKAYNLIDRNKLEDYRWYSYMAFGNLYEKMKNVSQAKYYNQKAYELAASVKNDSWLGMCLNNTGNTYLMAKEYQLAQDYYRRGITYLERDNNESFLCESYLGLSSVLYEFGKIDSAIYYAKKSLRLATNRNLSSYAMQSCQLLTDFYVANKHADSALVYQARMLQMKDSIYSQEKVKQIENLTVSEKLRQKEIQLQKIKEDKDRSYKLNMLMIGLLIPFFFLISVILSKRKIKPKVVEFSGILSLLLVFEYLTLLLHPIIGDITHHTPFLEIIILVMIAAVLTPTHHRLEHWMLHKLTHKQHNQDPPTSTPDIILPENAVTLPATGEEKITEPDQPVPQENNLK